MEARLLSWWQRVRKPLELFVILVGCTLMITLLVVIVLAYVFNADVPGLRGKTLWDWLQLLIIPAVLGHHAESCVKSCRNQASADAKPGPPLSRI